MCAAYWSNEGRRDRTSSRLFFQEPQLRNCPMSITSVFASQITIAARSSTKRRSSLWVHARHGVRFSAGFRKDSSPISGSSRVSPKAPGDRQTPRSSGAADLPSISRSQARTGARSTLSIGRLWPPAAATTAHADASQISPELLRRVRTRSGSVQHRSGVPQSRVRAACDSRNRRTPLTRGWTVRAFAERSARRSPRIRASG